MPEHEHNNQFHEILRKMESIAHNLHDLVRAINKGNTEMTDALNRINASLSTFKDTLTANTTAVDAVVASGGVATTADSQADLNAVADKIDANNMTVAANTAKLTGIPAPSTPVVSSRIDPATGLRF